jgi:hypothetical protein
MRNFLFGIALWLFAWGSAFPQPVTKLPQASAPLSGAEILYLLQNGQSKQITAGNLAQAALPHVTTVTAAGAKCDGTTDDSPFFQAAIASVGPGGYVLVPPSGHSCVLKEGITLGSASQSGVSLIGLAGAYWAGYNDNTEAHWTAFGSWIRCDDKVNACITVAGNGSTIDGLNFWYTQPTPPGTVCGATCVFTHDWNPTVYPYTISIPSPQNFNHFRNINIVNATHCIDMEGPSTGVGSFYTYFSHMQLGCFNVGMKFGKVDNHIKVDDVDFIMLWYQAYNDVWGYMEGDSTVTGHKVDIDMYYLSDANFDSVQFYQSWAAIRATNASVGSGLGTVTFAGQGLMFNGTNFNQVCQAIVLADSSTVFNADFTNTVMNIDPQTSFTAGQCGAQWPYAININSNSADVSFTNLNGFMAQTLANVGGGTSGGLHLSGRVRMSYSSFAAGAPAIKVNTGGLLDMASGVNNLFPANGSAGPQCSGACRNWPTLPAGDQWLTGAAGTIRQSLFSTVTAHGAFQTRWGILTDNTTETGTGNAGSNWALARYADSGSFLDFPISIQRSTGVPYLVNGLQANLPTSCTSQPTGTLWNNAGTVKVC